MIVPISCYPPSAWRLIQSVYDRKFSASVRHMLENAITTISKKDAMTITSKSWREVILNKTTNIASGLRAAGLWPLYFSSTQRRLKLLKGGGIADSEENPTWMRCWETFQTEVLPLLQEFVGRPHRRWTIDANNRLL